MEVKALIVEQLDADGTLRTFKMVPDYDRQLVVAFAEEYDEHRYGPFHFLDSLHENNFRKGFASAKVRHVGKSRFSQNGDMFNFKTSWLGLPIERNYLTYYALSLPQFAVPEKIRIFDPHSEHEYRKYVYRDDEKTRFTVYFECRSSRGVFDFQLECNFRIRTDLFESSEYIDEKTDKYGRQTDEYKWPLNDQQATKVQQFFMEKVQTGDTYKASQVGAMGPNATASNMTFQQVWLENKSEIDLQKLTDELALLRTKLRETSSEPKYDIAVGKIAAAEAEAKSGNGAGVLQHLRDVSSWVLQFAKDVGVNLVAEVLKISMSI